MAKAAGAAPGVPEELLWEVLVRLPAKDLLLCRAVCRSWRHLTTSTDFLHAYHRLQPSLPLVSFRSQASRDSGEVAVDASLETCDLRRTPAERRPVLAFNDYSHRRDFTIHASCDGLLLLSLANHRLYICNPATRQWALLPGLYGGTVAALYLHRPSGEYRVLFWKHGKKDRDASYNVPTVGSSKKPRCIGLPMASDSMKPVLRCGILSADRHPPVMLHRCLHWGPGYVFHNKIIVFDTVVESFIRLIPSPTAFHDPDVHEMDGMLGISLTGDDMIVRTAKLWVFQDYEMGVWSLKYWIELPVLEMTHITGSRLYYDTVIPENGDVLICCRGSLFMFRCDSKGKLVDKFLWHGVAPSVTGHWFKESLVSHAFLQMQDGAHVSQPYFFRGL